nr:lysine exporter LysO family protein [Parasphaerochaeta coccoides]
MASLIGFLLLGIFLGRLCAGKEWVGRMLPRVRTAALWLLLFMMGISTGSIEGIMDMLSRMGIIGLASAILAIIGSVMLTSLLLLFPSPPAQTDGGTGFSHENETNAFLTGDDPHGLRRAWHIFKEPLLLLGIVLGGITCGVTTGGAWFDSRWISILLRFMMVLVGMLLMGQGIRFSHLLVSPRLLFIPLCTIAGSVGAALLLIPFTGGHAGQSMAITAGLGWYSLSSVMITDFGLPVIGTISLLANLMRETLAFFLIPLFGRFGRKTLPLALTSAAATTMDVTLPLISSNFGAASVGIAIYNGIVTSIAVPFLIPLVLGIGA